MRRSDAVVGAVLAGGGSRRMGSDKALLELDGRSLALRAVDALSEHLDEVVIVSAELGDHAQVEVREIADRFPGKGPLGGIHAALEHARGRAVFALACDLPRVGPELVGFVLEQAEALAAGEPPPGVVAVEMGGREQPLCAVYAPSCRRPLEERILAGELRTLDFAASVGLATLELTPLLPFFREDLLFNVNAPTEARRLGALPASAERPGLE